ncbi:MAG: pilus assembly protein PilM [Elusimicrobia bacterium]|nr:pilus assembly protein PilM [Elusimicrobiota bacterium]
MALDEFIDQLAFGSSTPQVSACLGMYLSPEVIYIAEARIEKGKPLVDHLVRIPVPAPAEAAKQPGAGPSTTSLNTDFLSDGEKLALLIRQSMSQTKWKTKNVMVTLSHHLGLLRYFTMPEINPRFWKSAIPLEAKKYIPIPLDILSHDYQVIALQPDANNKARQGVLIAVTQKKNIAAISTLLQGLELNLVGMEVAPCSVLRLWQSLEPGPLDKPLCQVHFDGGNIRILVADKGLPVFFRELFLGSDVSMGDIRKVDLGGCVAFAQKQLGVAALGQVKVSGAAQALPSWQAAFSQELGLPAGLQDTAALLGIKGGDWGGYASIGTGLRFLRPATMNLDLGRVGKVSEEDHRVARDIFMIAAFLSVCFLALGLGRMGLYRYKSRELARFRRDPEIEAVFTGKTPQQIEEMIKSLQGQVESVQGLGIDRVKVSTLLKDVAESLPEKTWITNISLTNPLVKGSQSLELRLSGHAVAPSLSQEQDLAFQFKEQLIKSKVVGKTFSDIQLSVTGKPLADDAVQGLDPGALMQRLETRTQFVITARARKPQ